VGHQPSQVAWHHRRQRLVWLWQLTDDEVSPVFGDELKTLKDAGVFIVASSGNNGVSNPPAIQYPAADPNVYAVGAVDEFGTITEFTERNSSSICSRPAPMSPRRRCTTATPATR
jgi:hypothetical protein